MLLGKTERPNVGREGWRQRQTDNDSITSIFLGGFLASYLLKKEWLVMKEILKQALGKEFGSIWLGMIKLNQNTTYSETYSGHPFTQLGITLRKKDKAGKDFYNLIYQTIRCADVPNVKLFSGTKR